jgi:hypothetical protein
MNCLDLQSERVSATGNLASEGVLNQLGRPRLDPLTVLVREAVQNSWDAQSSGSKQVLFGLAGRTLKRAQVHLLREEVFASDPGNLGLQEALSPDRELRALAVYDRGTSGLAGPTRADAVVEPGTPQNFVNFLRNVGQPSGKQFGGGTYGYGKAALFLASGVRTLCVHTRCESPDGLEARFLASALGSGYSVGSGSLSGNYTGRHWWGRWLDDVVEPLRGEEADRLASDLGLPGFATDVGGTTLLILGPQLGPRTPEQALRFMAMAFLWNFWPKLLPDEDGTVPMAVEVSWEGIPLAVPHPRDFPPLEGFVRAMEHLKAAVHGAPPTSIFSQTQPVESYSPYRRLGTLSLERFQRHDRLAFDVGDEGDPAPIDRLSHHVALMRQPELVVRYHPGPELASDEIEYAGVFITDPDVDPTFARAEPPTHDDWVLEGLQDPREKSSVRVTFRRIDEALAAFAGPPQADARRTEEEASLGSLGDELGSLIPAEDGPGARAVDLAPSAATGSDRSRPSREQTGGAAGTGRAYVVPLDGGRIELVDEEPAVVVRFEVRQVAGARSTIVSAQPIAVLDNGEAEREPPAGGAVPEVLLWRGPKGDHPGTPEIEIFAEPGGPWEVAVSLPGDAMVAVDLTARAENG